MSSGMGVGRHRVVEVTYEIKAHASGKRFRVPMAIARQLGSGDDGRIWLLVRGQGKRKFRGDLSLASGTEAYYRVSDYETAGLDDVQPNEELIVTARRATT